MAAADVLTATGGLPPSAFSLLPQDAYFPSFTSINDTILPHPDDHSNFYVDGAFDPLLKDLGPNQYGKLQYNYADPGVGQNVHFEDQLEGQGLGELLELQCDCVAICCCAHTVDSWFQDVVTPDPIERVQTSLPSINTANIQDGRGSSTRASLNNVIEDDSFAERRPKKPTPQKFAHPPVAYRAAPAEMKAERSRPAFTSSAKIALDDLFQLEPYPDDAEITSIAENTKMTIKQVKTWFSNKRSRSQRSVKKSSTKLPIKTRQGSPKLTSASLESLGVEESTMDMSPTMAKYLDPGTLVGHGNTYLKASFQMNAGIKYDAIGTGNELTYDRNAASLFAAPFGEEAEAPTSRSDMAEGDSIFADGYVHSGSSSVGGSVWSGASSFDSLLSGGSSSSIHSRISRKGRRQWKTSRIRKAAIRRNKQSTNAQGNAMPRFTCTFCSPYQHFNSRYAWNRHEEAIHVPRSLWVCNGVDSASGLKGPCFYCTYPHDSLDQMSRHNHLLCVEKPEATRTFTRRDGLVQHLHTAHKGIDLAHMDDLIQRWQRKLPPLDPGNPILVCSFCCFVSPDWESRVNHVGNHFKEPWMQCFDWSRSESSPLRQLYSLAKAAFQNGQMTDEPVQPVAHTAIADLKPPSFKPATILKELLLRLDSWAHVPKEFTQSQRIKFNDFMVSQLTDESLDSPAMELERHIESQFKLKNYDWYGAKRRETTRSILRQLGPLRLSDILQDNMLLPDYWTLVALHRLLAPAPLRFQHHSY